jgi:RNA polymerase sigma-70 factor (ECF subfamily)
VLRRTDNADDAADVIAETFLTAWRRLDEIPAGDQARLWLYGVARHQPDAEATAARVVNGEVT